MLGISPETSLSNPRQNAGITLRDVVFILFRRRWIILAVCLPIIVLGGTSLFQQTGSFTASSRVVVELTKVDLPQWNTSGRNLDYDRELSTLFNIAMSLPVAEKAAAAIRDSIPVLESLDPNLMKNREMGNGLADGTNFRDFLLGGLDVNVVGESNILEFRFSSAHPKISMIAVGAMRDAFVEYQVYGRKNTQAVVYYDEQIGIVRGEIDSLLTLRGQVLTEYGYSSLEDELRYDSGQLADLEGELSRATVVRKSLEMEYNWISSYLDKDPRDFPMGPDENRSQTLIYWRNMVSKHDDEYNSILTLYTPDSVVAQRHREMIDESLRKLAAEQRNYVTSVYITLQSALEKENALREQIAGIRVRNSKAPDAYKKVSLIDVEITSVRGLLEDLQGKKGEVRLSQLADERVSNVVVLTEPELASLLSGGKTIVYFVLIVVFALALGFVAAFVLESLDHRVYSPRDVEEHLKLPVFASVTRTD